MIEWEYVKGPQNKSVTVKETPSFHKVAEVLAEVLIPTEIAVNGFEFIVVVAQAVFT